MRRALTASVLAGSIVLGGATPALAGPADRATKELQREIAEEREDARVPAYQRIPDCCEVRPEWGYADLILGITFAVGLVVLW